MIYIEKIKQVVEDKHRAILADFNEVLEQHGLSERKVIGVKLGIKDEQTNVGNEAILKKFNEVLERNGLGGLFVSSFLTRSTRTQGFCTIKVEGLSITIDCG